MQNDFQTTGMSQNNGTTTDGVKAKATEALSAVRERATEKIESRISEQQVRAADTVSGVAHSLRTTSQTLQTEGQADIGRYIEKAAGEVDRLANYLQSADVRQVAGQVQDFARRSPGAFIAGAFAVGFLASRFLKSTRDDLALEGGTGNTYRSGGFATTGNFEDGSYETSGNYELSRGSYGEPSTARTSSFDASVDDARGV